MPFYLVSEIVAPVFELLAIATLARRGRLRARRLVAVCVRHARDHARQQRIHTGALLMTRSPGARLPQRGMARLSRVDASGDGRLPADHGLGAHQGDVAVPPRRPRLAQVRAQRARRGGLMGGAAVPRSRHGLTLGIAVSAVTLASPRPPRREPVGCRSRARRRPLRSWSASAPCSPSGSTRCATPQHRAPPRSPTCPVAFLLRFPTVCCSSRRQRAVGQSTDCVASWVSRPRSCSGRRAPLPFWPPEHAHEIEGWLRELEETGRAPRGSSRSGTETVDGSACSCQGARWSGEARRGT